MNAIGLLALWVVTGFTTTSRSERRAIGALRLEQVERLSLAERQVIALLWMDLQPHADLGRQKGATRWQH